MIGVDMTNIKMVKWIGQGQSTKQVLSKIILLRWLKQKAHQLLNNCLLLLLSTNGKMKHKKQQQKQKKIAESVQKWPDDCKYKKKGMVKCLCVPVEHDFLCINDIPEKTQRLLGARVPCTPAEHARKIITCNNRTTK